MKKVILVLTCLLFTLVLSGCSSDKNYQGLLESNRDYIQRINIKEEVVCLDGIEYIMVGIGYQGYMSPHLTADQYDNPKVIRCKR